MRTFLLLLVVAVMAAAACYLRWGAVLGTHPLGAPRPAPSNALAKVPPEVRDRLQRPVAELRFEDAPLDEVIEALRQRSGLSIFVNWRGLRSARVTRDSRVTVQLGDVTAAEALAGVLDAVQGRTRRLSYEVDAGGVNVSTTDDLNRDTMTRVYDVRNLLPPPGDQKAFAAAVAELQNRLRTRVAPGSWRDEGGTVGSVRELAGQLIVTQTEDAQAEVTWQLERMRWRKRLAWLVGRSSTVVLPAVALAGLARGAVLWRRRRRARVMAGARCARCGYDLRATPDRCPECGLPAPADR